ncbi:MAG: hypothetical protein K2M42_03920 [Oscillospiraceae bacterium]|nr:hypothetical protein [Oscillospiraceae bacterium]
MKKYRTIIIIFAVIGLLLAGGFLWEHLDEKHEEKLIQAAQNAELGEGVTLRQGVQAYFGDFGDWNVVNDTVYLEAGNLDKHVLSATFQINEKTGQLDILTFDYDFYPVSRDELDSLINAMIQAARR